VDNEQKEEGEVVFSGRVVNKERRRANVAEDFDKVTEEGVNELDNEQGRLEYLRKREWTRKVW
jgi:hypothetical protein